MSNPSKFEQLDGQALHRFLLQFPSVMKELASRATSIVTNEGIERAAMTAAERKGYEACMSSLRDMAESTPSPERLPFIDQA